LCVWGGFDRVFVCLPGVFGGGGGRSALHEVMGRPRQGLNYWIIAAHMGRAANQVGVRGHVCVDTVLANRGYAEGYQLCVWGGGEKGGGGESN
jgi:hypothetical protein